MSAINWKALIPGIVLLAIAGMMAVTGFDEVQRHARRSVRRTAIADGDVYSAKEEVSKSGIIKSWKVGYEFLGEDIEGTVVSVRAKKDLDRPEAPAGMRYYVKLQTLTPEEYAKVGLGIAKVKYDTGNPDNSELAETSPPDFPRLYVAAPTLGVIGGLLFLVGIWGCFGKRESELDQDE